eukprot:GHVN01067480.1.p1 GENE.GHVN01067480.1~~GHVN01067480.1.p1  ORF type:complete len:259 (+),score=20.89 GHVN01067480.1:347-1123(+)
MSVKCANTHHQYISSGGYDGMMRQWDSRKMGIVKSVRCHDGPISSIDMSNDDSVTCTGSLDGIARLWHSLSGTVVSTLMAKETEPCVHAFFSPSNQRVITIVDAGPVQVESRLTDVSSTRDRPADDLATVLLLARSWNVESRSDHINFVAKPPAEERPFYSKKEVQLDNLGVGLGEGPGPFVFGCSWRDRVCVPCPYDGDVHMWDSENGIHEHILSNQAHGDAAITCVASPPPLWNQDTGLLATAGESVTKHLLFKLM